MRNFSIIYKMAAGMFVCLFAAFFCFLGQANAQDSGSCVPDTSKRCYEGDLYWYDSCGNRGSSYQQCSSNTLTAKYKCNGDWVQRETLVGSCANDACVKTSSWTNVQNCAESNKICINGVCSAGDTTPPAISGMSPSGTVRSSAVILSVTTDEPAACRYSWYNKQYDQMTLSFTTANNLYHTVTPPTPSSGDCLYYVRCRDTMGNVNPVPVKIKFKYAPVGGSAVAATSTPESGSTDTAAPVISDFKFISNTSAPKPAVVFKTDENAYCRYDFVDTDYDSMANSLGEVAAADHDNEITVNSTASNLYVRCKDEAGNKNGQSEKLALPAGPIMTGLQPQDTVYQSRILLSVTVNKEAECRYSLQDNDFDEMTKSFFVAQGLKQEAVVELDDFGPRTYYVRCKGMSGDENQNSAKINFKYAQSPEAGYGGKEPVVSDPAIPATTTKNMDQSPIACDKISNSQKNGVCDPSINCDCDSDCPADGADADPDCQATTVVGNNDLGMIVLIIVLAVIVVAAPMFLIFRRHGKSGNNIEV